MKKQLIAAIVATLILPSTLADAEGYENDGIVRAIENRNVFFMSNSMLVTAPQSRALAGAHVRQLVRAKAREFQVPESLAYAVTHVESGFRCDAVGPKTRHGHAYGPLQILASSAARLGFTGSTSALRSCGAGLHYGMAHLAQCWRMSGGSYRNAAHCHVQGPARNPAVPVNAYAASYGRMVVARLPITERHNGTGWLARGSIEVVSVFSNPREAIGG